MKQMTFIEYLSNTTRRSVKIQCNLWEEEAKFMVAIIIIIY